MSKACTICGTVLTKNESKEWKCDKCGIVFKHPPVILDTDEVGRSRPFPDDVKPLFVDFVAYKKHVFWTKDNHYKIICRQMKKNPLLSCYETRRVCGKNIVMAGIRTSPQEAINLIHQDITAPLGIPQIIREIQQFLMENPVTLPPSVGAGRNASTIYEDIVADALITHWPAIKHGGRIGYKDDWYDIIIPCEMTGLNYDIPINIKVSKCRTSDNATNFKSILYAYSNLDVSKFTNASDSWKPLTASLLSLLKGETVMPERDYWFVVIDKNNTHNVIVNSMRGLIKLTPNASNYPFQINWRDNAVWYLQDNFHIVKKLLRVMCANKDTYWRTKCMNMAARVLQVANKLEHKTRGK